MQINDNSDIFANKMIIALVKVWDHGDSNINAMVVLRFSVWVDLLLGDPSQQQQYWCPWGRSQLTAFFLVSRGRFRICGGAKKASPKITDTWKIVLWESCSHEEQAHTHMVSSSEEEKKLCHKKKFKQNIYELEVRSSDLKSCSNVVSVDLIF